MQSKKPNKQNQTKLVKRTIKFLSSGFNNFVVRAELEKAPKAVIRGICNAAINARKAKVKNSPHPKLLFCHHSTEIDNLINRQRSLGFKRWLMSSAGDENHQT